MNTPTINITVSDFEANRLTFRTKNFDPAKPGDKDTLYMYDARGHNFVNYPITGDPLKECEHAKHSPKSKDQYENERLNILFDAYNDGDSCYFSFYESGCYSPPLKLIVARNFEEAYDIYLDEFASAVTLDDLETEAKDEWYKATGRDDLDYAGRVKAFAALDADTRKVYLEQVAEEMSNNGSITGQPNSNAENKTGYVHSENINGFELELIKAEKV